MLMNTQPSQVPTLTWGSVNFALSTCGKSHAHGRLRIVPSRFHDQPWNWQVRLATLVWPLDSWVPRCRQLLW